MQSFSASLPLEECLFHSSENWKKRSPVFLAPLEEPTEWCAPIVVVPKANGDIRNGVDEVKLAVKRELYQTPAIETTLGSIEEGAVFSRQDANSGFHQVVLGPECQPKADYIHQAL